MLNAEREALVRVTIEGPAVEVAAVLHWIDRETYSAQVHVSAPQDDDPTLLRLTVDLEPDEAEKLEAHVAPPQPAAKIMPDGTVQAAHPDLSEEAANMLDWLKQHPWSKQGLQLREFQRQVGEFHVESGLEALLQIGFIVREASGLFAVTWLGTAWLRERSRRTHARAAACPAA